MAEKKSKEEEFFMIFQSITGCMGGTGGVSREFCEDVFICSCVGDIEFQCGIHIVDLVMRGRKKLQGPIN